MLGQMSKVYQILSGIDKEEYEVKSSTKKYFYKYSSFSNSPSIDPKCVIAEELLKLRKMDYDIVECDEPCMSPNGELPFISDSVGNTLDYSQLIHEYGIENTAEGECVSAAVRKYLEPAVYAALWCDDSIYNLITKPFHRKKLPWLISAIVVDLRRREIRKEILMKCPNSSIEQLYEDCIICLRHIALWISENPNKTLVHYEIKGYLSVIQSVLPSNHDLSIIIRAERHLQELLE